MMVGAKRRKLTCPQSIPHEHECLYDSWDSDNEDWADEDYAPPTKKTKRTSREKARKKRVNVNDIDIEDIEADVCDQANDEAEPPHCFDFSGVTSSSEISYKTSFLDLPRELRDEVYQHLFVVEDGFDLGRPKNFSRGAAFLRSCKQVYWEGCKVLYEKNHFIISRQCRGIGSQWTSVWPEIGFKIAVDFVQMIGPKNIGRIRQLTYVL
jgi:hypothetical protein